MLQVPLYCEVFIAYILFSAPSSFLLMFIHGMQNVFEEQEVEGVMRQSLIKWNNLVTFIYGFFLSNLIIYVGSLQALHVLIEQWAY